MINLVNCPSTLAEGHTTYSHKALIVLFDGKKISHILDFNMDEFRTTGQVAEAMQRISVSGVQEKFPAVLRDSQIKIAGDDDRSTYILKPAPWDKTLYYFCNTNLGAVNHSANLRFCEMLKFFVHSLDFMLIRTSNKVNPVLLSTIVWGGAIAL